MAAIEFWFDYSCPYAYLASTQLGALHRRTGADIVLQPMLLGGVFAQHGTPQNLSQVLAPPKAAHNELDLQRWARRFGVPLRMPPAHPMRTVEALRATLLSGIDERVVHGFYRAYWVEGREPSSPETIASVLSLAGHDPSAILPRLSDPAVKDDLRRRTDRAIALGIFGAPTFVAAGKLFFGQDRMPFVERALGLAPTERGSRPAPSREHTLEVYWDFSSPFAYLGCSQAEAIAERTGAKLEMRPMLLGGIFKALGTANAPILTFSPAKQRYVAEDLARWAEHWGLPLRWPSRFPISSVKALRCWLALPEGRRRGFRDATFRAYWAEDRDIASDDVLADLIGEGARAILEKSATPEIREALFAATQRALDAGVFGAPTWIVDGQELFWGQDRTELVEAALRA
jgi:2-hydroxychromene-2-carboxylate isomerase